MHTSLVKIPQDLSDRRHIAMAAKILAHGIDGIELSWAGAGWGPVWKRNTDHDLSFLRFYKGIRTLRLDLPQVTDLHPLLELSPSLRYLHVSELDRNNLSFGFIGEMQALKFLSVVKHTKELEAITRLPNLASMTLKSYSLNKIPWLNECQSLKLLRIILGGSSDLKSLDKLGGLEELEIIWVKQLSDITAISNLKRLIKLSIEDEQHISRLPDLSKLKHLKNVCLRNIGALKDISALTTSHIKEFILNGPIGNVEMLKPLASHKGIERVYTFLKNKTSQKKAEALLGNKFQRKMIFKMDNSATLTYFDPESLGKPKL